MEKNYKLQIEPGESNISIFGKAKAIEKEKLNFIANGANKIHVKKYKYDIKPTKLHSLPLRC